jgi:hypothetical protein
MLTSALIATLAVLYTRHRERIRARFFRIIGRDADVETTGEG